MPYAQWLDLVKQSGASPQFALTSWLQSQHAAGISPVVVSQQIKANNYPMNPPLVQSAPVWRCRSCGSQDFFFEANAGSPSPITTPQVIVFFILTLPLLCLPIIGLVILFGLWIVAAIVILLNPAKKPGNYKRCKQCGWTEL